jgi:NAD(P)H-dependent FMN reductase
MLKVGIITGSTRPNRKSLDVAKWVLETARKRSDAEYASSHASLLLKPGARSLPLGPFGRSALIVTYGVGC